MGEDIGEGTGSWRGESFLCYGRGNMRERRRRKNRRKIW